jgi:hypothetical protein
MQWLIAVLGTHGSYSGMISIGATIAPRRDSMPSDVNHVKMKHINRMRIETGRASQEPGRLLLTQNMQLFLVRAVVGPFEGSRQGMLAKCMIYANSATYTTLLRDGLNNTASNF